MHPHRDVQTPLAGYAIDDQTAIKVTDGAVEVVSEGQWKLSNPYHREGQLIN